VSAHVFFHLMYPQIKVVSKGDFLAKLLTERMLESGERPKQSKQRVL
jgi:hypothetical protein